MKALILAAGYATRLYPLTLNQPKPLLKIAEKPIIEYIIEKLENINEIDTIYIITNNKFYSHFIDWSNNFKSKIPIKIINDQTLTNEDRLGAVGDMAFAIEKENIQDELFVIAGDNIFEFSLLNMVDIFKEKNSSVIIGRRTTKQEIANKYGNIILGNENKIINFKEKPANPESDIASTAIYLLNKEALEYLKNCIKSNKKLDNTGDFIKYLSEKQAVYVHIVENKDWYDIGNKEQLEEAKKEFK